MPRAKREAATRRVLLKVSGEGLGAGGYDPASVRALASEIAALAASGVETAIVVGGGNLVRGRDLLHATPAQIRLGRLLGRATPASFLHHRLIRRPDGSKLSKSSGDTGVREMRAAGWSADRVIEVAAIAVGLDPASVLIGR